MKRKQASHIFQMINWKAKNKFNLNWHFKPIQKFSVVTILSLVSIDNDEELWQIYSEISFSSCSPPHYSSLMKLKATLTILHSLTIFNYFQVEPRTF